MRVQVEGKGEKRQSSMSKVQRAAHDLPHLAKDTDTTPHSEGDAARDDDAGIEVPGDGPPRKLARTAGTAPADLERQPVQIQTSSGPVQVPLGKFHDGCAGQYAGKTKFRETAEWKGKTGIFCGQLRHGKGAAV